jgi:hypothetical protein
MFSLPGMMSFAITPTTNPMIMVIKKPNMIASFAVHGVVARDVSHRALIPTAI